MESADRAREKTRISAPFDAGDYWENRLSTNYNLQGVGDIGLPVSYNVYLYRVRSSAFSLALGSLPGNRSDWSVLDIGSGTGFYIREWLALKPASVDGADITATATAQLRLRFPAASFTQCDIGGQIPAPFVGKRFNVITAYDVLFHIVDDTAYARAFANFATLLHEGGYLIFSDNLSDRMQAHGTHQISRSEADVRTILIRNGFTVERVFPMFVFMNDPVRTRSRIMRRLFNLTYRLAARSERWGRFIGAFWFPIELLAIRFLRRGPSTEVFVCRKLG